MRLRGTAIELNACDRLRAVGTGRANSGHETAMDTAFRIATMNCHVYVSELRPYRMREADVLAIRRGSDHFMGRLYAAAARLGLSEDQINEAIYAEIAAGSI